MHSAVDRNLLYGVLGVRTNVITPGALGAAVRDWAHDKARPLGLVLCNQGVLRQAQHDQLEALVQQHLQQHANDPARCLASLGELSGPLRLELEGVNDAEVQSSLERACQSQSAALPEATMTSADAALYQETTDASRSIPPPPESAPRSAGRYRVLRLHAKGGLGQVFVAEDLELHREVALKEIQ